MTDRIDSYLDQLDHSTNDKYPDSANGAVLCLQLTSTLRTSQAECHTDPHVLGMWMVVLPHEARLHVLVDTIRGNFQEVTVEPKDCPCTFCMMQLAEEELNKFNLTLYP